MLLQFTNMRKQFRYLSFLFVIILYSCSNTRKLAHSDNGKIDVNFVLINDVYEIAPLEGGKTGGMARVATVKKELLQKNPNTYMVMAGDFLSPSVYNSLKFEGSRIRGRQMVEAMNDAGVDLAIFGNHEFDINENELLSRINESRFKWISSNTFHQTANGVVPFAKTLAGTAEPFAKTYIMTVRDADGTTARIGFMGLTLPFNNAGYVNYTDLFATAQTCYNQLKDSCDAVVAITHQLMEDDSLLALKIPGLALILGGHEHDMRYGKVGNVIITKAHANARSAYIITLELNKIKHQVKVSTRLQMINDQIAADSLTDAGVKKWMSIGEKNYAALGFDARKVVMANGDPLDGRESMIRTQTTNFTKLIVQAMKKASPESDLVLINSGSIRVDDILQMPVTQYDIIRSLPFGGSIMEVDMKGSLLLRIMAASLKNMGIGGFLQYSPELVNVNGTGNWSLHGNPIDPDKVYKIALTDFLMTGGEANMDFLKKDNPEIIKIYPTHTDVTDARSDIRLAIIKYIAGLKP